MVVWQTLTICGTQMNEKELSPLGRLNENGKKEGGGQSNSPSSFFVKTESKQMDGRGGGQPLLIVKMATTRSGHSISKVSIQIWDFEFREGFWVSENLLT